MAQGQIIVRRKKTNETRIQNSIIWDENISLMSRFSLIAMLSLRDGWDYSVRGMAVMLGVSKDTMAKYMKELECGGYLKRIQNRGEGGSFSKSMYILTDTPWDFGSDDGCESVAGGEPEPCPNLPDTEEPDPINSPQQYTGNKQQIRKGNNNPPKAPQGGRGPSKYDLAEDAKPMLREYCGNDNEMARALADLIEVRREKKAINSKRGIKALLSELDRLSEGHRDIKLLLLRQSIANSWKSVFPLRQGNAPPSDGGLIEEEGVYLLE